MSATTYQGRIVRQLYAYSVENNDAPEMDIFKDTDGLDYYAVPNCVPDWGPTVMRDHIDSMRFAAKKLFGNAHVLGFFIELEDGFLLELNDGVYHELSD